MAAISEIEQIASSWGFTPLSAAETRIRIRKLNLEISEYPGGPLLVATRKVEQRPGGPQGVLLDRSLGILRDKSRDLLIQGDRLAFLTERFFYFADGEIYNRPIGELFPSKFPSRGLGSPIIVHDENRGPALEVVLGYRNIREWFEEQDQMADFQRGLRKLNVSNIRQN